VHRGFLKDPNRGLLIDDLLTAIDGGLVEAGIDHLFQRRLPHVGVADIGIGSPTANVSRIVVGFQNVLQPQHLGGTVVPRTADAPAHLEAIPTERMQILAPLSIAVYHVHEAVLLLEDGNAHGVVLRVVIQIVGQRPGDVVLVLVPVDAGDIQLPDVHGGLQHPENLDALSVKVGVGNGGELVDHLGGGVGLEAADLVPGHNINSIFHFINLLFVLILFEVFIAFLLEQIVQIMVDSVQGIGEVAGSALLILASSKAIQRSVKFLMPRINAGHGFLLDLFQFFEHFNFSFRFVLFT